MGFYGLNLKMNDLALQQESPRVSIFFIEIRACFKENLALHSAHVQCGQVRSHKKFGGLDLGIFLLFWVYFMHVRRLREGVLILKGFAPGPPQQIPHERGSSSQFWIIAILTPSRFYASKFCDRGFDDHCIVIAVVINVTP